MNGLAMKITIYKEVKSSIFYLIDEEGEIILKKDAHYDNDIHPKYITNYHSGLSWILRETDTFCLVESNYLELLAVTGLSKGDVEKEVNKWRNEKKIILNETRKAKLVESDLASFTPETTEQELLYGELIKIIKETEENSGN